MAVKSSALGKRVAMWVVAIIFAVLCIAWIQGGEEPIRTITQPVDVSAPQTPENVS